VQGVQHVLERLALHGDVEIEADPFPVRYGRTRSSAESELAFLAFRS
jgi:hypothetical protein